MSLEQEPEAASKSPPGFTGNKLPLGQVLSVLAAGIGIGWLCGLSWTPVIAGVITSLLGVAAGVVSALGGLSAGKLQLRYGDSRPIALLIVGVAIGASTGIYARAHSLLSPVGESRTGEESKDSAEESELIELLKSTALFSGPGSTECHELLSRGPDQIRLSFRSSRNIYLRRLEERIEDPKTLVTISEVICKKQ